MERNPDVLIVGGGLAGLTAGIHLSQKGLSVTIIERTSYPKHKVCGEYISNEVMPYLKWLGADVSFLNPVSISKFEFSSVTGHPVTAQLPLGGFGVSRYALDNYLCEKAKENGCKVILGEVKGVNFIDDKFYVESSDAIYTSKIVLGAFGKRSNIDKEMNREFIQKKSPWLAVKGHYKGEFPNDTVALHNFPGGYCGVSKVENDVVNVCYLADYETFKKYKNIEEFQLEVLYKNKNLKAILENSTPLFDKPLTISQVSFDKKLPVENHILMMGDTAGLIHPLCGNGMAMAIHSAKVASEFVSSYFDGTITSREELEKRYAGEWKKQFSQRLKTGRLLGSALHNKLLTRPLLHAVTSFPSLLPKIIKRTHGQPIDIAS
ncbi:FAD-dependent oxidoreductase [Flavobacterium album]|uniref:FAD-dependent oxidoreductase n=1 Tax=Flavobacterium album TaxID=2175091 RepID=A0A2S1R036_9FLAO|nr:NAD(P)/FAD-dependent oxidoreductase [Flavobacterium album]AWH86032.1 FAD-dependent oxidoreductase [Flavobacterium album]